MMEEPKNQLPPWQIELMKKSPTDRANEFQTMMEKTPKGTSNIKRTTGMIAQAIAYAGKGQKIAWMTDMESPQLHYFPLLRDEAKKQGFKFSHHHHRVLTYRVGEGRITLVSPAQIDTNRLPCNIIIDEASPLEAMSDSDIAIPDDTGR